MKAATVTDTSSAALDVVHNIAEGGVVLPAID
jgi:hypothetical protein